MGSGINAEWARPSRGADNSDEPKNVDKKPLEEQERERYAQNTKHRHFLMRWVVWADSVWLGLVVAILALCGLGCMDLGDGVLAALLGTTTANVLGLAHIVLRGLFGGSRRH